jgi:hypothetical protein
VSNYIVSETHSLWSSGLSPSFYGFISCNIRHSL